MPRGDGTGPMGMGPLTGRGAGFCTGFKIPGFANPKSGPGTWFYPLRGLIGLFWIVGFLTTVYLAYRRIDHKE